MSVDLNALASSKLRVLLPVLPITEENQMASYRDTSKPDKIQSFVKLSNKRNVSSTTSSSSTSISINDTVYGYKSIVLKKITEEGLKDVLKNGEKSKATATVTYKVIFLVY